VSVLGVDPAVDRASLQPRMGIQLQEGGFVDELTVLETLQLWQRLVERTDRPERLLDRFELTDRRDVAVSKLSGGEKRRLDLAMAVWGTPELVVLDEPTTGLDPASRAVLWDAITGLVRGGTTILLTTQYLEEADRLADRVVLLHEGRVAAAGTADELKARVGGDRVEVEFATAADLDLASARRVLALASDGSAAHLRRLLDDLAAAGAEPARVTSHRPTLDDVFLTLTAAGGPR
jgi:ABC-2 type transport system ATP-binding protein